MKEIVNDLDKVVIGKVVTTFQLRVQGKFIHPSELKSYSVTNVLGIRVARCSEKQIQVPTATRRKKSMVTLKIRRRRTSLSFLAASGPKQATFQGSMLQAHDQPKLGNPKPC